jgi:hypothetical protein
VWAKKKPDLDITHYINLANKKKISINPAVRDLVNIYDIEESIYAVKRLSLSKKIALNLAVKRAVTVRGDNITVYWLRLQNTGQEEININLSSIKVKDRAVLGRALEEKKDKLLKGEYVDLYLVLEGAYTEPQMNLNILINNEVGEFNLKNIPYKSQKFKVFISNDSNYDYVTVEDYRR